MPTTKKPPTPPLTVRDYFAAAALQGLLAMQGASAFKGSPSAYLEHGRVDLLAQEAYLLADAMLKARQA